MSTIRLITNDEYSNNPCVMDEAAFDAFVREMIESGGDETWADADFSKAGPIIRSEEDLEREIEGMGEVWRNECRSQYRALNQQA